MKSKAVALTISELFLPLFHDPISFLVSFVRFPYALGGGLQSILAANWQAHLNTIKADAKGSKESIHSSKVHYFFKRGKPYIWVHENDLHNTNTIIDERGSLAVISTVPGPLVGLLRSIKKFPARVALAGDVLPIQDDKVQVITKSLRESIRSEHKAATQASYAVSAILSSGVNCRSRSEIFQEILDQSDQYVVYKFNIRSCTYVDGSRGNHDVEVEDTEAPKADLLLPFSENVIDGINQNRARRRALMLFCFEYHNANVRDALMISIDRNGFDVLGKVPEPASSNGLDHQYVWKEFRFTFKEEACDIDSFCRLLVELEEEALHSVKSYSGLG